MSNTNFENRVPKRFKKGKDVRRAARANKEAQRQMYNRKEK